MKITKVCCQGCGADLQVDESVRYVTCNYCHARLEVVHDTSVTHTRLMEQIHESTQRMAGNLGVIELQNDLERLDREWESRKEGFMMSGKHGHRYLPSTGGSIFGGAIMIVFGIFWMSFTGGIVGVGAPGVFSMFPLFGLLIIGGGIYTIFSGSSKASAYQSAEQDFQQQRARLIRQIEEARRG
jgi:hypothetical protein